MAFAHAGQYAGVLPVGSYKVTTDGTTPATVYTDVNMDDTVLASIVYTNPDGGLTFFVNPGTYQLVLLKAGASPIYVVVVPPDPVDAGTQTVDLSYAASDPFPVQVLGAPEGYDGSGTASILAEIVVGDGVGFPSGVLLQPNADPVPDGWTFQGFLFVEGGVIYDVWGINAFTLGGGGLLTWGTEGGQPASISFDSSGGIILTAAGSGNISMPGLPTSDPVSAGALYDLAGVVKRSAG